MGTEEVEAPLHEMSRALSIIGNLRADHADADERTEIPPANPEVEEVLTKALGIAEHLNHTELHVAHVLLAMTLTEVGRKRLSSYQYSPAELRLSPVAMHAACWRQMATFSQLPSKSPRLPISRHLKDLLNAAIAFTRERNILNSPLQLEDLLRAILHPTTRPTFADLLSPEPQKTPTEQVLAAVADLTAQVQQCEVDLSAKINEVHVVAVANNKGLVHLNQSIGRPITPTNTSLDGIASPPPPTLWARITDLFHRIDTQREAVGSIQKAVGMGTEPNASVHNAITLLRSESEKHQHRTETRVRTLKVLLLTLLGILLLLGVGAVAAAVLRLFS